MYTQLEQRGMEEPPVNVSTLTKMKIDGEPIACLTAYDASFALLVDRAGTDLILVGDSLGMVIQGHDTTVPVTVEDIIYHTRTVTRGLRRAFLVADMPFMSYSSKAQALDNAVRLMQEGGAMMVKLEGGAGQISIVEHLAHHDIPVCAHIGLRPQSVHKIGGFKVQGRNELGKAVQAAVHVPVIGIGAGPDVDGQILVLYDILGITHGRVPRFVENFMAEADSAADACLRYVKAVKERAYPAPQHCFS
jgi:3-methyl-2-oxobutanoate hydroxymethyltransferase